MHAEHAQYILKYIILYLDTCELVFLVIFIAEMLFKMFGLGFHTYFASAFNCFDFTVRDFVPYWPVQLTCIIVYVYNFLTYSH